MKRVLVTGGRNYRDRETVYRTLDALALTGGIAEVIHGAATGADALAHQWCMSREVQVVRCPADWKQHGNAAGPIRNRAMLAHRPDLVVAFPGGKGTADMVKQARRACVDVIEVLA